MIVGFFGIIFFDQYHGNLIPFPNLWFVLSFIIIFVGVFFEKIFKKKTKIVDENVNRIEMLKATGEKLIVDIDSCEFKSSNFQKELEPQNPLVFHLNDNSSREINQNVIVYKHKIGDKTETFVSHRFYIDEVTLQYHIIKKDVILYVDKANRSNYYFNLR